MKCLEGQTIYCTLYTAFGGGEILGYQQVTLLSKNHDAA